MSDFFHDNRKDPEVKNEFHSTKSSESLRRVKAREVHRDDVSVEQDEGYVRHLQVYREKQRCKTWNFEIEIAIFREKPTSVLAGYHAGSLSWSNWNLQCWFLWKEENRRINLVPRVSQGVAGEPGEKNPWEQVDNQ